MQAAVLATTIYGTIQSAAMGEYGTTVIPPASMVREPLKRGPLSPQVEHSSGTTDNLLGKKSDGNHGAG